MEFRKECFIGDVVNIDISTIVMVNEKFCLDNSTV